MARIISIAIHKGGTGKTVTAINLGAGLAREGKRTLIVDLDQQGHCALGLGVEIAEGDLTLRDFFGEPGTFHLKRVIKDTAIENLSIAPSTIRLAPVAQALFGRPKREEILKRGLSPIEKDFDYILIDCPPTLGPMTECGITAAHLVIIPCRMEARAADALVDLLDLITTLKGDGFNEYRILINQFDTRTSVTNEVVMTQLEPWKGSFLSTIIPHNEALNQAQIEGSDIFTFDPKSKGASAYDELTKEILEYGNK